MINKTSIIQKIWLNFFVLAAILLCLYKVDPLNAQGTERQSKEYQETIEAVKSKKDELRLRYETAESEEEKRNIIEQGSAYVFKILTEEIFPAWHGTPWDFNGSSRISGEGRIACGTFVVNTLQDAGFKIPSNMSRQPSENIIKNLTGPSRIKRWSLAPMEMVLDWIRSQGEGLFIVGLDIHVGFIIYKNGQITFCHSSYYDPPLMVVNQDAMEQSPLTDSKYRVIGRFLEEDIIKWVKGESFPLTYDYFRRN